MPTRFSGKLLRFLFAHLEQATFGERLMWLDRQAGIFQILWKHGNHVTNTPEEDNAVFTTWHDAKQRRKPCGPMEAKQRFRVAARKMNLDHLKSWRDVFPSKYFQFWRFPPDDLAYLLKNADLDRYEHWKCASPVRRNTTVPSNGEIRPSPTKTTWWQEARTPQGLPVQIKQEPMSESETESETETETESESESESEQEPEPNPEPNIAVKAEPEWEQPEMEEVPDVGPEAQPYIEIKEEPETEPEPQPDTEPDAEPKTVQQEAEVATDRSKQQPANHDRSPQSWQKRPRRCRPRKCFCCMEP